MGTLRSMPGIVSYALHFAAYRLAHRVIGSAWAAQGAKGKDSGSRAVASCDEDALTLASAAVQRLVGEHDPNRFGGLFFASTTSPYLEKSVSTFLAHAHRLPKSGVTADFANSRRAATQAVLAACDAVEAKRADNVLVCVGDTRKVKPGSPLERVLGDGGGAVCIGESNVLAEIVATTSVIDEGYDEFRRAESETVNEGDMRFAASHHFANSVAKAVRQLFEITRVNPEDIAHVAIASDSPRGVQAALKMTGLDTSKATPGYLPETGYVGSAQPIVALAAALEKAKPGEKILWVSYGDGVDAFLLEATERVSDLGPSRVAAAVGDQRPLDSYGKYLQFQGVLETLNPGPAATPVLQYNERDWNLPLLGNRCGSCNLEYYPPQTACFKCGAIDGHSRVPLPKTGHLFTFTKDYLVDNPDSPQITCVVELDNGSRLFLQGTDFAGDDVKIGVPVELQIRKLHDGSEFPVYYWKARPTARRTTDVAAAAGGN